MKCPNQTFDAEHLRECPECAALASAQRSVAAALDLWEAPPVSADFDRRLYQRIAQQEVPWWDFLVQPFRPLAGPRWLPVAAAAGLMMAVGLWVGKPGEAPMPRPTSAQVQALPPDQAADALQEMQVMQEFSNLIHSDADPRM
jgi:hypothetical protein